VGTHDIELTAKWSDDPDAGGNSNSQGSNGHAAPTINSATISGATTVGNTLTATPVGVTGTPTPTASFHWQESSTSTGVFTNISGATGATYLLLAGDAGKFLRVTVSETNNFGTSQTVTSSTTPQIAAAVKTVVFNSNCIIGCSGSMAPQSATGPAALTGNGYQRLGYSFSGWNTASNGSGVAYLNGGVYPFTSNVTLYAQWAPITFSVSFNSNGGSGSMANETGTILSVARLTSNSFTRTGYRFVNWNIAADGSGISFNDDDLYPFIASVTLYAQWLRVPTPTPTPPPTKTPAPVTPPVSIPTPKTKLTGAEVQKLAPGLLVPHASKKLLVANQVVALSESISIKAPAGYSFLDLIINGKKYKVAITDLSNIPLPILVGPKDKVVVELIDANGNVLDDPITQQSSNVALANVNFDVAKYSLSKAAKTALDKVAKVVVQHGFTVIDLTGYTDAQGLATKFNNQKLSQQRGQMTAAYLKSKLGKAKISIKVEAKAHLNPVASNSTPAGQAMNRRVEISVH